MPPVRKSEKGTRKKFRGGGAFYIKMRPLPAEAALTAAAPPKFHDQGGRVLNNVQVQLVFWGPSWNRAVVPSSQQIVAAARTILASNYMSALSYYRNTIGSGALAGSLIISSPVGSGNSQSPGDPPQSFANSDIERLVSNLVNAGKIPGPDAKPDMLYCIVLPPGIKSAETTFDGEHFAGTISGQSNAGPIAWLTNNGTHGNETDFVTSIFSHELVEACTDPEGDAIVGLEGTCNQPGWCEIADVTDQQGRIQNVIVQAYWSDHDGAAVIPT